jgi:hypothetical protein
MGPLQELFGLGGFEVVLHREEVVQGGALEGGLGGIEAGERGFDFRCAGLSLADGMGEVAAGAGDLGAEAGAFVFEGFFDGIEGVVLGGGELQLLVHPVVKIVFLGGVQIGRAHV